MDSEIKNITKNVENNGTWLSFDGVVNNEKYFKGYWIAKRNLEMYVFGETTKKSFDTDGVELKKIIKSIAFNEPVDIVNCKMLENPRWLFLTKNDRLRVYVDFDTVRVDKNNKCVDIWAALESKEDTSLNLFKFYMKDRQVALLSGTKYDNATGSVIYSYDASYLDKKYIVPETLMEMLYDCINFYLSTNYLKLE